MSIVHVNQVKNRLQQQYAGKVDNSDLAGKPPAEQESNFLSRALAAFALEIEAEIPTTDAANGVIDGYDDNGIDAVYVSAKNRTIYAVQSKWIADGNGSPDLGSIEKFVSGIEDLLSSRFDRFNAKLAARLASIAAALNDPDWRVEAIVVHTGGQKLADHPSRKLEDLENAINDTSDYLSVVVLGQRELYSALAAGVAGKPITLDIVLKSWGRLEQPALAFYGQVHINDVGTWWVNARISLFSKNLRSVLGDTDVNKEIRTSLEQNPQLFWYYNNGVTLVARRVAKTLSGGGGTDVGTFHCEDVSVVNGAQTVATIGRFLEAGGRLTAGGYVGVRIISLENTDPLFGDNVTRTNNRQNRIEVRDFVSLEPQQVRLRTECAIDHIDYQILRSDSFQSGPNAFDLAESTIALACASGSAELAIQVKREISKLWEDLSKAPYTQLFNAGTTGPFVWQRVQCSERSMQS